MTEVVNITEDPQKGMFLKIKFAFTTHTDGTATGQTEGNYTGLIAYVISDPGTTKPSVDWDFQIQNEDGYDLLNGAGANRNQDNTEYLAYGGNDLGVAVREKLTLEVSAGGDTKDGVVIVYLVN